MSPHDDICTTCHHPRHHHRNAAGMCTHGGDPSIQVPPCSCNLFRVLCITAPPTADERLPVGDTHIPPGFIEAVEAVFEAGVKDGRTAGDWKHFTLAERHSKLKSLLGHAATGEFDAAAANCVILWWHQREDENDATS